MTTMHVIRLSCTHHSSLQRSQNYQRFLPGISCVKAQKCKAALAAAKLR